MPKLVVNSPKTFSLSAGLKIKLLSLYAFLNSDFAILLSMFNTSILIPDMNGLSINS